MTQYKEITIGLYNGGCGHHVVLTEAHYKQCVAEGRVWYCSVCGKGRIFPGALAALKRHNAPGNDAGAPPARMSV